VPTPTILIVDDEPHLRTLIHQTLEELEDEGVELLTASNGEEALATIEAVKPNLVFLDVMMPKLSGFDVCQRTKQELGLTGIYIVLLTATQATTFRPDALSARHPQLVVLDLLYIAVAQRMYEQAHAAFKVTAQAVAGHRARLPEEATA